MVLILLDIFITFMWCDKINIKKYFAFQVSEQTYKYMLA